MIHAKSTTFGIDKVLKAIQTELFSSLGLLWAGSIEVYGKIQPTERDGKIIPEVYIDSGEYSEIFINDKVNAVVGFNLLTRKLDGNKRLTNLDVIFTVNLKSIYANTRRDDEKAVEDAIKVLKKSKYINSVNTVKEGIKDVFSAFDTEKIKHRDMQPFFVFSINIDVNYYNDTVC